MWRRMVFGALCGEEEATVADRSRPTNRPRFPTGTCSEKDRSDNNSAPPTTPIFPQQQEFASSPVYVAIAASVPTTLVSAANYAHLPFSPRLCRRRSPLEGREKSRRRRRRRRRRRQGRGEGGKRGDFPLLLQVKKNLLAPFFMSVLHHLLLLVAPKVYQALLSELGWG